jgi:hypothetical protein
MCIHGNSAPLSSAYIDAQLSQLYRNAVRCAETGPDTNTSAIDFHSDDYIQHFYLRALAEFYYAGVDHPTAPISKENLLFEAHFGEPRLNFVCNHEAVLSLTLNRCRFSTEYENAGRNLRFDRCAKSFTPSLHSTEIVVE